MNNTPCLFIYMQQTACNQDAVSYLQLKKIIRYKEWQRRLRNRHYTCDVNITKCLTKGYDSHIPRCKISMITMELLKKGFIIVIINDIDSALNIFKN